METKDEQKVVKVGILLMLLSWLQPNKAKNPQGRLEKAVKLYESTAVKMFGEGVLTVASRLTTTMVDSVMTLCLDGEDDDAKQSSIWRLIGAFFAKIGAKVGNLKGRSSTSAWNENHRNSMACKVLVWAGFGTGANSSKFDWVTVIKDSGRKGLDCKGLINNYLSLLDGHDLPLYEDLVDAEEEVEDLEDLEDVSSLDDAFDWDEEDDDIDAGDAVIDGKTGGERMNNAVKHYMTTLNDTKILAKKEKAHSWFMGMLYSLIGLASGDTPNLNLYYRKTKKNNTLDSLFSSEKALEAIAKGVGTTYTSTYKNKTTTTTVQDLRERGFQSLIGTMASMVMKSLHMQINGSKAFFDFTKSEDIEYKSFFGYCVALVLNSLENGADANKLGYGFIREIKSVGNYDMYEAMLDHFKIDEDHEVFYAPMTDDNDDEERQSGWDDWEMDIIN